MPAAATRFVPELHPHTQFGFDGLLLAGNLVVAGTGHRADDRRPWRGIGARNNTELHRRVQAWLREQLYALKPAEVVSGGALDFDTWLGEEALEQGFPLTVAIPFRGQELRWPPEAQERYRAMLKRATEVVNVSGLDAEEWLRLRGEELPLELVKKLMQDRNRWMVDRCNLLLACWDGTPGGTSNCVAYARRVKKPMRRLDPSTLRLSL